jgi:hypothetical protein
MEFGGNARVNAIFEARLAQSGVQKPSNHADGPTRERFIRDKYERRKFFDGAAYGNLDAIGSSSQQFQNSSSPTSASSGPPVVSEAARQRLEARKAGGATRSAAPLQSAPGVQKSPSRDSDEGANHSKKPVRRTGSTASLRSNRRGPGGSSIPKAPVSAPLASMDLLDLTTFDAPNATFEPEVSSSTSRDSGGKSKIKTPRGGAGSVSSGGSGGASGRRSRTSSKDDAVNWLDDFATQPVATNGTPSKSRNSPPKASSSFNDDILSLYSSQPTNSMGFPSLPGENTNSIPTPYYMNATPAMGGNGANNAQANMMMNNSANMMNNAGMMGTANMGNPMNMQQQMMNNPQMMAMLQNPQLVAQMTAMMQSMNFNNGNAVMTQQQQQANMMSMMMNNNNSAMFPAAGQNQPANMNKMAHTNAAANSMQGWFPSGVDGFGTAQPSFNAGPAGFNTTSTTVSASTTPSRKKNGSSSNSNGKADDPFAQFGMNVFRS